MKVDRLVSKYISESGDNAMSDYEKVVRTIKSVKTVAHIEAVQKMITSYYNKYKNVKHVPVESDKKALVALLYGMIDSVKEK